MSYSGIDPSDIDPDTGRPYANYSSASLDTGFHEGEVPGIDVPMRAKGCTCTDHQLVQVGCDCDRAGYPPIARTFFVSVFLVDRAYGGPEEGGWYYDCGQLVRTCRMFKNERAADAYRQRLDDRLQRTLNKGRREVSSVLSEGRYSAEIQIGRAHV